jgi:uncharacterized protein (DUF2252 family)
MDAVPRMRVKAKDAGNLKSTEQQKVETKTVRMGRMAASPFTFLRGSACVMVAHLSTPPFSGISVIIDGDPHLNNFGFYGTPQREVVFDLNDFDEVTIGPSSAGKPKHISRRRMKAKRCQG